MFYGAGQTSDLILGFTILLSLVFLLNSRPSLFHAPGRSTVVVLLAPFFRSYRVNLPSSLSISISRLSTLIPVHLCRPKYGYKLRTLLSRVERFKKRRKTGGYRIYLTRATPLKPHEAQQSAAHQFNPRQPPGPRHRTGSADSPDLSVMSAKSPGKCAVQG